MLLNTFKKILFYWILLISVVSLINVVVLYWFPVNIPFSSYLATSLMSTAYFLKAYYLIPVALLICAFIACSAFSFLKKKVILSVVLLVYFLIDSFFLGYRFFSAWFNDELFITMQGIQILINLITFIFICIYIFLKLKHDRQVKNEGRQ